MSRSGVSIGCSFLLVCQLFLELEAVEQILNVSGSQTRMYANNSLFFPPLTRRSGRSRYAPISINQRSNNLLVVNARKSKNYDSVIVKNDSIYGSAKNNTSKVYSTQIWETENGVLKQTEITDFSEFQSDKCYVLFQSVYDVNTDSAVLNTFYWVGKYSTKEDASVAASQAVLIDSKATEHYKYTALRILREPEGEESPNFKAVFEQTTEIEAPPTELPKTVDENRKRMFVIDGEDEPYAMEVELSSRYILGTDNKCVVLVSNKIYVACRKSASKRHERSAGELAKIMMERRRQKLGEVKIHKIDNLFLELTNEETEDLLEFFAHLDVIPAEVARQQIAEIDEKFSAREMRRISDQVDILKDGSESFRVEIIRLYDQDFGFVGEEDLGDYRNASLVLMNEEDCHLIDTRSNLGLIVWLGKDSREYLRKESAKLAEIYLAEHGYNYTTPILYIDQREDTLDTVGDVQGLIRVLYSLDDDEFSLSDESKDENNNFSIMDDSETVPIDQRITIIWTVQNGRLNSLDNVALESDKTYVLFENIEDEKSNQIEPSNASIYYWIGKDSSYKDAADAASHAMTLDFRTHQKPKIYREVEGQESQEFKSFFKKYYLKDIFANKEDKPVKLSITKRKKSKVDMERKKMFVIEGRERASYREVELSFVYILGNENNCLVLVSKKVYVVCGNFASESKKKGAKELAIIMSERRGINVEDDIKVYKINKLFSSDLTVEQEEDLLEYFAQFDRIPREKAERQIAENPEEFSPKEERRILDQTIKQYDGEEWFNLKVYRIYEDYIKAVQMLDLKIFMLIPLNDLNTEDCYLVDSQSNAGLFLWIGKQSSMNLRKASARQAEMYLREQKYDHTTHVTFTAEDDVAPRIENLQSMVYDLRPENKAEKAAVEAALPSLVDISTTSALGSSVVVLDEVDNLQSDGQTGRLELTLAPIKKAVEEESKDLDDSLEFSQLIQLLENGYKKSVSAKNALTRLGLTVIHPDTILAQLDMIYIKTQDKTTRMRINKIKKKIKREFYE